jgi:ATP-binding cassette subfamily B protein
MKVLDGEITVGGLTSFLAFMTILQAPVRQLGLLVNSIARGSTCGVRLFEVLDDEPAIADAPQSKPLEIRRGVLRFEDVAFDYAGPGAARPTVSGISFEAGPGQTIGIVGPPGSGKSTIAHLIPRFYDVTAGRITIDGQDIREVTLESLRRAVGVVQQDAFVFTTSIENNIAYGDPWAQDEHIAHANSQAQLHDYVARLPTGYGTLVGERGVSLSAGQRQRLTIARGVMLKPAIMVFDDSTASIDAGTERRIRTALAELASDRVTVIISHRLGSLMHADEILFIEAGRIVERGTHDELIARGGRYHDLYQLQVRPGEDALETVGGGSRP